MASATGSAGSASRLPNDVEVLQRMIVELRQVLADERQHRSAQDAVIADLLRRLQRMPRDVWAPDQPALFPELDPNAAVDPATPAESVAPVSAPQPGADASHSKSQRKGHGRRSLEELAKSLEVIRCEHQLTEAEQLCPCCGQPRRCIGEHTSQQVEYVPAKLMCVQHVQFTYSCPHCPEHIATAPKPPQPIDRGLAGPGLLALIVANKFDDYLPLYRQELILWRYGLFLARSTLCDWIQSLGNLVAPLLELLKQDIFQSRVLQTDGTSVALVVEGQPKTQTGYFWPCLGDAAHPGVVVDFSPDKTKEYPQRFLTDYCGYLQADAYAAYDGCFAEAVHPKIEVGCWSHARSYFESARESAPGPVAEGLAFIDFLFDLEARAKREHLGEAEFLALRQQEAVPRLDALRNWLDQVWPEVLPKSPLAEALRYLRNQWAALCRYTEAGYLSLENNATERLNKLIARGRINWLFVGSQAAGVATARLLSLVLSCRRLCMDPFLYLRDLFTRLPGLPSEQLPELLPHRWLATHPEAKHPPERQSRRHGDPRPRRPRRHVAS
jgi:transposase